MIPKSKEKKPFLFVGKCAFFPDSGILVLGDLQIGYEIMLKKSGFYLPLNQLKKTIDDIKEVISLVRKKYNISKVILLGDIKHHFGFDVEEKFEVRELLDFLELEVGVGNLILIRGNHEKFSLDDRPYLDFFFDDVTSTFFLHGDKSFPEMNNKNVVRVVMGHIHPAVILSESGGVKKEKFKCFLVGKYLKKEFIVLPSFFPLIEGTPLNTNVKRNDYNEDFGIVPLKELKKFIVFIVGNEKTYEFGKLRDL